MQRVGLALLLASLMLLQGCLGGIRDGISEALPEQRGKPGGLTLACLSSSQFTDMVLEIDHAPGYAPEASTIQLLTDRLNDVCDKPDGIRATITETEFSHTGAWSADDVRGQALEHREAPPMDGTTLRWHLLFPAGGYDDESVLGVAVNAADVAVFRDSIDDAENILRRPSAEDIENSVTLHEVGHLLGLVNLVYTSPRDHEDPDHPGHSSNEDSVMYWAVESSSLSTIISGELPNDFDDDDRADLEDLASGDIKAEQQLWRP
ncbi:MAG: hypothetical protein CMA56_00365 [Euryarchaeota archaeon]|nr:hypothetical protein [Euryarchaeota archaeon]|tara:strand:- start:1329 stop:2117 length:789 start_codon:yes stop_codon:yes gene_type:complete